MEKLIIKREAKKGDQIRITDDYYGALKGKIFTVKNSEPSGVFIKEYGYIILHSDYEIVKEV